MSAVDVVPVVQDLFIENNRLWYQLSYFWTQIINFGPIYRMEMVYIVFVVMVICLVVVGMVVSAKLEDLKTFLV